MQPAELARHIDQALLKPEAGAAQVVQLCREARAFGFFGVCVHGSWVRMAADLLEDSGIKVVAVVGFPLGAMEADVKRFETEAAIDSGAQEIDMVLNLGRLKGGDDGYVLREIRDVVEAADERVVKVILETGILSREEKIRACQLVLDSGARFVKTCSGFAPGRAVVEDVKLLREVVGPGFGVKASGGIADARAAEALIGAGANRLGTSRGAEWMRELASGTPAE